MADETGVGLQWCYNKFVKFLWYRKRKVCPTFVTADTLPSSQTCTVKAAVCVGTGAVVGACGVIVTFIHVCVDIKSNIPVIQWKIQKSNLD